MEEKKFWKLIEKMFNKRGLYKLEKDKKWTKTIARIKIKKVL